MNENEEKRLKYFSNVDEENCRTADLISLATAGELRNVNKSAIRYHVLEVIAGKSKHRLGVVVIDGVYFVVREDILKLEIQILKSKNKKKDRKKLRKPPVRKSSE